MCERRLLPEINGQIDSISVQYIKTTHFSCKIFATVFTLNNLLIDRTKKNVTMQNCTKSVCFFYVIQVFFLYTLKNMRRREIQSFTLKLSDLKEYELVRQEYADSMKSQTKTENTSMTLESPMKMVPRWGPKSNKEIRERIGLNS